MRARGATLLRSRQLARDPARGPRPDRLLRSPRPGNRRARRCASSAPRGSTATRCGRTSSVHFIGLLIDHKQPECAETFFNSVLGEGPAPRLFPQPVHLRPAGDLDRAHRRRSAVVSQLLSAASGAAQRARSTSSSISASSADSPTSAATFAMSWPRCARRQPRPFRLGGESPDPGAGLAVRPQPDRLHRRPHHQRDPHVPVRRARSSTMPTASSTSTRC